MERPFTVLALHGQPGMGADFAAVARALGGSFDVITPDRPGWGARTSEPAGGLRAGADDAVSVLDRRGIDRMVVLGFSWGGGVALELARRHPDRVAGLVLAGSIGPGEPTAVDRLLALPLAGPAICAGGMATTRLLLRRPALVGAVGAGRLLLRRPALVGAVGADRKGLSPDDARRFADSCLGRVALSSFMVEQRALVGEFPAVLAGLGDIAAPTTVVTGDRDRLIAPSSPRRLADGIAGADLRVVPGAGHFLPGICPEVLAEAVAGVAARAAW